MAEMLQSLRGGDIERSGGVIGHWAGWRRRSPWHSQGRSGSGRSSLGGDGGDGGDGDSSGPGASGRHGWRLLSALVPQGASASRQPGAAGGSARGALCALRLHPRPLVRGLLFGRNQSMEVRGPGAASRARRDASWPLGLWAKSPPLLPRTGGGPAPQSPRPEDPGLGEVGPGDGARSPEENPGLGKQLVIVPMAWVAQGSTSDRVLPHCVLSPWASNIPVGPGARFPLCR